MYPMEMTLIIIKDADQFPNVFGSLLFDNDRDRSSFSKIAASSGSSSDPERDRSRGPQVLVVGSSEIGSSVFVMVVVAELAG
jgi:hypothetical protein